MPVIAYLEAGERGAESPTGHNDDRFSRDSVMVAAIVAGGARARKSGVHEKVGNVVHRPPIDALDHCLLLARVGREADAGVRNSVVLVVSAVEALHAVKLFSGCMTFYAAPTPDPGRS